MQIALHICPLRQAKSAMSEQSLPPPKRPVTLEVKSRTVRVENQWVHPLSPEQLVLVEKSEGMLVLRISPWDIHGPACVLTFFWVLVLGLSLGLLFSPSIVAQDLAKSNFTRFLVGIILSVLFLLGAWDGIWRLLKCRFYFDRDNGQVRLGALPNSPCYPMSEIVAIQLLESSHPRHKRQLQLNLVMIKKGPTSQRINLQTGNEFIRYKSNWVRSNCLEVMKDNSSSLAKFLNVPLLEQCASDPIQDKANDTKVAEDLEKLSGTWLLAEADGRRLTEDELKRTLVRKGNDFKFKRCQDITVQGRFEIDSSQDPKHIDIRPTTGSDYGTTIEGIFSLDGDTYKECFAVPGEGRPTEFKFQEGISLLRVYKRIK
jgi:uncharacterized protein (TIGR03067 family)